MRAWLSSPLVEFALAFVLMVAIVWPAARRSRPAVAGFPPASNCLGGVLRPCLGRQQRRPEDDGNHRDEPGPYSGESQAGRTTSTFRSGSWRCADRDGYGDDGRGVRIIQTMGTKIIELKPVDEFAAETKRRR